MTQKAPFILSIDMGTSSVRTQVYDTAGIRVDGIGIQIQYSMINTPDGGAFIDLREFAQMVYRAIDKAVDDSRRNNIVISSVASCTFWHSLTGIDPGGNPCIPLIFWNDTRPETILPELKSNLDPAAFTQRTGCPMHASYLPAKITWLHKAMPEQAKRVQYWMSAGEYILYTITGQRACSYSMASASGLLDSAHCQWDQITIDRIPVERDQFSPLCDAGDSLKGLRPQFAQRWPSLAEAPWYPSLGDGACSNIGCGCSSPNRVGVMVGTSGAMRAVWRGGFQPPPEGLWCYRIDRERPIKGGALSNGGNLIAWMHGMLNFSGTDGNSPLDADALDRQLQNLQPDGHGLTFLPFLAGQRSPRWNPHSTGTIHGLRLSTKPVHILQAGLESIAFRFKLIHNRLQNELDPDHVIVATGGGLLHSPAWVRILANVLGREVCVSQVSEASCRGAALVALETMGALSDIADADLCAGDKVSPDPDAHSTYQAALKRHEEFEFQMIP